MATEKENKKIKEESKETPAEETHKHQENTQKQPDESQAKDPEIPPLKDIKELDELEKIQQIEKPKPRSGNRVLLWILISVALLIGLGMLTIAPYMVNGSEKDVTFRIPKNATMQNVSDTLRKYFSEDYSNKVVRLMGIYGFDAAERHGLYYLPKGATPFATMRKLSRGGQSPVRLTINGFRSLPYLAQRIGLKMEFSPEEFLEAAKDSAYLTKYGLTPEQALSLFLEDSYDVYWTSTPKEVLDKIGENYLSYWTEGKREIAKEELGLTPAEMMIIASIADEESNQILEKGRIGRLYINRLDKNMKLQADPTVRFAINDFTIRRVTNQHLKFESPYNTYIHDGLPPGPIRTTSRKTLSAILDSKPSTDLYMCARPDFSGYHNFAATYDEHMQNARSYQAALDERGIK